MDEFSRETRPERLDRRFVEARGHPSGRLTDTVAIAKDPALVGQILVASVAVQHDADHLATVPVGGHGQRAGHQGRARWPDTATLHSSEYR
jgi:hypothetical protein